ncbi:MAG: CtsR family transcriptional regulator [Clostridia bacterium]|nr:CtsR family transcriptional regulator [Clostridiales bacterium]MBQ2978322.1 CtsR family transcriptional regulator [Clostridia bacterium]MBQ6803654.1 CtsR family transcriptional regulator [Clostridia bacterium]
MRLSDTIESFIKQMLQEEQYEVELKRNELAEYFHCAPSQINYVLATRFTPDHGYVTSSQRGGGGYIRIVRVRQSSTDHLSYLLRERIGDSLDAQTAQILCAQLAERKVVSLEQAQLMAAAVSSQALSAPAPEAVKDAMRAKIMKYMLLTIAQQQAQTENG